MSNVTKYVRDAFKSLDLLEDTEFELDSKEDFEELDDFINADGDIPEKEVIDLEAETEEEVKDSYIGEVILECPVCHSDHFDSFEKAQDYIETYKEEHDGEEPELVFEGEACPVCGNEDGFKIIGKVAPFEFEDEEEDEVEVETDDDDVEVEVKEKEEVKEALKRKVRKSLRESKKLKEEMKVAQHYVIDFDSVDELKDGRKRLEDAGWDIGVDSTEDPWFRDGDTPYLEIYGDGYLDRDVATKLLSSIGGLTFKVESRKSPRGKKLKEDTWDVTDQIILKRNEPGVISKMHELRNQGYSMSWCGNGQLCFTKPKKLSGEDKIDPITGEVLESKKSSKSLGEGFERKLEPGDTIVVGGSKVTVGKILDQYFDKDYIDIEFEDESGNYRTWKSDVDGGKVIYKESRKSRKGRKLKEATTIKGLENAKNVAEEFKNYAAYKANFKPLTIVKQGKDYFVYKESAKESSDYVQFGSKEYIDGWLYGCVQAKMKIVEGKKLKEDFDIVDYYEHNKEVPDVAYEMASEISDRFSNQKEVTWDEFNAAFEETYPGVVDWTEDAFNELEADVRGILSQYGWETVYEGENEGGLRVVESRKSRRGNKLTEAPVYELRPQYDSRQSFYGKAQVDTGDKNDKNKLYSYGTLVAEIKDGKPVVYGTYSQTTLRHIKDWLKQNGFKAETSKQIITDYGVKDECVEKHSVKESTLKKFRTIRRLKEAFKKNGGKKPGKKLTEAKMNKIIKKLVETWGGQGVIDDLVDRAKMNIDEGDSVDTAVTDALDSGLIYSKDIIELAQHYGVIDDSELIDKFYEELYDDVYREVVDYEPEFDGPEEVTIEKDDMTYFDDDDDEDEKYSAINDWLESENGDHEVSDFKWEDQGDSVRVYDIIWESLSKKSGKKLKEAVEDSDDEPEKKENKPMSFAEFKKHQPTEDGISTGLSDEELKKEYDEYLKDFKSGIKESIESATIETEDQVINVSSEDKEENMLDDFNPDFSNFDEAGESNGEEMIAPLSDEEVSELSGDSEEEETAEGEEEEVVDEFPEDEEEFEFDEVQEESFNRLVGNYLNNVYSNAKSFKLKEAKSIDGQLKITGTIDFKSGKSKDTTFIFEKVANRKSIAKNKARFVGLNETFTDKKNAYVLRVSVKDKKLVAESLRYDYPAKGKLNESVKTVKGLVK